MKTANEIIAQSKRLFVISRVRGCYKHHTIAEIGRTYLRNISRHYGKPYGPKTWQEIGDKAIPSSIYAK